MENTLKTIGGVAVGALTFSFGTPDQWWYALIAFVVIDYISGVAAAAIQSRLSSNQGFKGILKKLLMFAVVAVAHIADNVINAQGELRNIVVGFLIANEGLSVLENCGNAGLPIPKPLMNALQNLKGKDDSKDE